MPKVAGVDYIDLQLSFEERMGADAQLLISYALASGDKANSVHSQLQRMIEIVSPIGTTNDDTVMAFRTAWQLAVALGGTPLVRKTDESKVDVEFSIPLQGAVSSASVL